MSILRNSIPSSIETEVMGPIASKIDNQYVLDVFEKAVQVMGVQKSKTRLGSVHFAHAVRDLGPALEGVISAATTDETVEVFKLLIGHHFDQDHAGAVDLRTYKSLADEIKSGRLKPQGLEYLRLALASQANNRFLHFGNGEIGFSSTEKT